VQHVGRQSLGTVYTAVRLFIRTVFQKPMQLGSTNLIQKCCTMSPGSPFISGLKVKGQGHESPNIAAGCVRKLRWAVSAAMPRHTIYATIAGFSLRHFHASAAVAARY